MSDRRITESEKCCSEIDENCKCAITAENNKINVPKNDEYRILLNYFVSSYNSAFFVNLADDTFEILHMKQPLADVFGKYGNDRSGMIRFIDEHIHPDDKELMNTVIDKEYVKERLKDKHFFSFSIREEIDDAERIMRVQIIRCADEEHVAVAFMDVTEETCEQQKHLLGAVPLSQDILSKANIGLWSFELDKGKAPRMYVDDAMLRLLGLETQLPPEETYLAWFNRIDEGSCTLVFDAVERMKAGEHAEVQYPWHHPNGHTVIVRCGGVRNPEYKAGIRIEGTHQDVTATIHFDEKEIRRLKLAEIQLQHEQLRAEVLSYMVDRDDDPIELMKSFAERFRALINCDQVVYRDLEETRIMVNSPALEQKWSVPIEFCRQCEHFDVHHPLYDDGYTEMYDCQKGWRGVPVHHECPIKSSLTRIIYCDGEAAGNLSIFYLREHHDFTDIERSTMEEFARILSMSLSRYKARKESKDKKRYDIIHEIINSGKWSFFVNAEDEITGTDYSDELKQVINNEIPEGGYGWLLLIHPEDREYVADAFYAAISDHTCETPYDVTFRMCDRYERYHWFHAAGRIIRTGDGAGEFFGIHIDISEQIEAEKQQQRRLEEALAMAQSANRAKTTFLSNMSHDIRTPMNAIIGYTGLAASHIDSKELVQDYLRKIEQSSNHLLSLINDVLDMSRIESGKMNLEEKEENLSEIIHTLSDIVQTDIRLKQLDFSIDVVGVNDENIICDKLRLKQVLLNILSNAIKYTAVGGAVSMRVSENNVRFNDYASYEFCIRDNGMGMESQFLKTIFDPFTRVKSSTVSGIQGTGLGMAITKNIVDMMGGQIVIDSEPGKGTEVKVLFDFKLINEPGEQEEPEEPEELKGLRALVVDDDANACLSICTMLRNIGMRFEWCTSGKEAVIRADAAYRGGDLFRVFIIDLLMPDMNGIETARRIRMAIGDDAPVIILTAYDWSDIEREAKDAGVTAFASKPIFPSDLHRVLNSCLGKKIGEHTQIEESYDFSGKKILLVEDNMLNREIATKILEEEGFVIDAAEDGDIAVEKIRCAEKGDYDLILMDVQMPTLNGYDATRQIRALCSEISRIPIIAMTANAFDEDRKAALEAGMDEHIAKPIDVVKLKKTLAKFLL